jgi:hypothetical protein
VKNHSARKNIYQRLRRESDRLVSSSFSRPSDSLALIRRPFWAHHIMNTSLSKPAAAWYRQPRICQLLHSFAHAPGRLLHYLQGFRRGKQPRNDQDNVSGVCSHYFDTQSVISQHSPSKDNCSQKYLICDNCWRTVFSIEGFYTMRQISPSDDSWYKEGGLKYRTSPWAVLQQVATQCHFCNMVCAAIAKCSEVPPSAEREFLVTVGLRLVKTGEYSPHPFEILSFVVDDGDVVPDSQDYTVCTTDGKL